MCTGAAVTATSTNVVSNVGKQEIYSPTGALGCIRGTVRGSPHPRRAAAVQGLCGRRAGVHQGARLFHR
eukprot:3333343-Prymnesium_polylepis.1